jgi:hypothetical protein
LTVGDFPDSELNMTLTLAFKGAKTMRDTTSNALDWKFADMPSGYQRRWLDWARSHDWGREAGFNGIEIYGCENWETERHGQTVVHVMTEYKSFSTPREMRDWAGY